MAGQCDFILGKSVLEICLKVVQKQWLWPTDPELPTFVCLEDRKFLILKAEDTNLYTWQTNDRKWPENNDMPATVLMIDLICKSASVSAINNSKAILSDNMYFSPILK